MTSWAATKAKAHFSAVLDGADTEGPQRIERRKTRYVLLTEEQYANHAKALQAGEQPLTNACDAMEPSFRERYDIEFPRAKGKAQREGASPSANDFSDNRETLADFFRNSPLADSGIDLERVRLKPRHIEL